MFNSKELTTRVNAVRLIDLLDPQSAPTPSYEEALHMVNHGNALLAALEEGRKNDIDPYEVIDLLPFTKGYNIYFNSRAIDALRILKAKYNLSS